MSKSKADALIENLIFSDLIDTGAIQKFKVEGTDDFKFLYSLEEDNQVSYLEEARGKLISLGLEVNDFSYKHYDFEIVPETESAEKFLSKYDRCHYLMPKEVAERKGEDNS